MKTALHLLMAAVILIGFSAAAVAADPPVKVTVTVNGDPAPGATVTAKAAVVIYDGATFQGIKWTQKSGLTATLANTATDTVTIGLPSRAVFREHLIEVLKEAPITEDKYPAHVPKVEFVGGLQNRFGIAGMSPHAISDAGAITFDVAVTTTSGTYHTNATVAANLPWEMNTGLRNVPILLPVVLHGKNQAAYNWMLTAPSGSSAKLVDATTQNPEFTPDVPGEYTLAVTDLAANKTVNITILAGLWKGMLSGIEANGALKVDPQCMACHVQGTPHFDLFTPWKATGHAEIFSQNVNTANNHYSASCLECHTVGYNATAIKNGGIDDQADFQALLDSGLIQHAEPGNWAKIVAQFPLSARFANIQCENCHGPQDSAAHMKKDGSRKTFSSELCGTCHGEPTRHGRFQQWQLSGHANYELAGEEGTDPSCGKCHSAQGYVQWASKNFSTAALSVTWTKDEVHPQTCQTCHDPHDMGTTSGDANTNAKVRVMGTTPMLDAGFKATNVGTAATCMTCHNGRRGLRDDAHFNAADGTRAPHVGPQTDILMGQNLYFTKVGTRGAHANVADSCVTCHMEKTKTPAALSNNFNGTNHTFFASTDICASCHTQFTAAQIQGEVEEKMDALKGQIETAIKTLMQAQLRLGNAIDLGGQKTIKNASDVSAIEFIESHGRQGVTVTLSNGTKVADLSLASVKVVRPAGSPVELYSVADPAIAKAGWNYFMVHSDKSKGVHNPAFVNSALDVSLFAVKQVVADATTTPTAGLNPSLGGGVGNGAGAVSCTTAYVYWAEIASHSSGIAGSQWRTDLIARNLSTNPASVKFFLHQAGAADLTGAGTINGGSQKAFEDIVASIGGTSNLGSLEICSDQPLLVAGRIFNQGTLGTFGQNLDGRVADLGYSNGQTVSLIGLRQKTDAFRSNISITNGGTTEAQVGINLYDSTGRSIYNYNLTIPAGQVLQDTEPFKNRANAPDVDWGFATVTVLKGTNILTSASMIDMKTNDPTTIAPKQ